MVENGLLCSDIGKCGVQSGWLMGMTCINLHRIMEHARIF